MQTPVPGTSPPPSSTIAIRGSVPLALIIGPAVGGGVVILVLVLCICVCICCVYKRRTRNKHEVFVPSVSEKLPSEVGSSVYRTLTPPEIHSDLDKKEVSDRLTDNALKILCLVCRIFLTTIGVSDAS